MKRAILIGAAGGVLIALLKVLEYQYFGLAHPASVYGGIVAIVFSGVGLYIGMRWNRSSRPSEAAPVDAPPAPTPPSGPWTADPEQLRRLGLTPREHEILVLLADGLSNREIAERLFVSENTVKTHCSRVFEKLEVGRRVQAVRKGRELRLIP